MVVGQGEGRLRRWKSTILYFSLQLKSSDRSEIGPRVKTKSFNVNELEKHLNLQFTYDPLPTDLKLVKPQTSSFTLWLAIDFIIFQVPLSSSWLSTDVLVSPHLLNPLSASTPSTFTRESTMQPSRSVPQPESRRSSSSPRRLWEPRMSDLTQSSTKPFGPVVSRMFLVASVSDLNVSSQEHDDVPRE